MNHYFNEGMAINPSVMDVTPPSTENPKAMFPKKRGNMACQLVYPEIFYRVQPFVFMACNQMDVYPNFVPTQEMVEQLTDSIYKDVCRMYPDLDRYNYNQEKNDDPPPMDYGRGMFERDRGFDQGFYVRRFRQRGSLQDLISILLLSELFRRRGVYY